MIIKNIENKSRLVTIFSSLMLLASVLISLFAFTTARGIVSDENKVVYVLKDGIPLPVQRTNMETNRPAEYKNHVQMFHYLFFNLPPDEKFIDKSIETAMYLIDDTGLLEYNNLKEKGYYSRILSSSAVLSVSHDSVVLEGNNKFKYYGKQRIERKTSVIIRKIETVGTLRDIPRTDKNPHGVLIENWSTIKNEDISIKRKRNL